ncbi:MAG: hypothetical protein ACKV2Q_00630 [Planctomycetaceae bacterium]
MVNSLRGITDLLPFVYAGIVQHLAPIPIVSRTQTDREPTDTQSPMLFAFFATFCSKPSLKQKVAKIAKRITKTKLSPFAEQGR